MDSKEHVLNMVRLLVEKIKGKGVRISSAFLFGSYAKGTASLNSDIDVAIVSPDFSGFRFDDLRKVAKEVYSFDADIEVLTFKESDFTTDNPFVEEIIRTGLKLA